MTHVAICALLAMLLTIAFGHPVLAELRRRKLGDTYSGDEPQAYASKAGTPTMGGVMFVVPIAAVALLLVATRDADILLPIAALLVGALLGGFDDAQTLFGAQKLTGHETWFWFLKWGALLVMGTVVAAVLYFEFDMDQALIPFAEDGISLGLLYLPIVVVVFIGMTSGAAITDGMDGLMAGVSALAYAAYGAIAVQQGQEELAAFAYTVAGATAAFLWFNANPAQVFMGDTGAIALAVGLVVVAFMTGWWLLLPVIGVVFFAEGLSDVIQIGYFKRTGGQRFFRMAPIHYHFQLGGWAETQVVTRFWLVGLAGGFAGIALAFAD
jgi:phospho-N-acetylmuramoyl-pentapeptide-transferase